MFRNWLIHKLGGYTFEEWFIARNHIEITHVPVIELKARHLLEPQVTEEDKQYVRNYLGESLAKQIIQSDAIDFTEYVEGSRTIIEARIRVARKEKK